MFVLANTLFFTLFTHVLFHLNSYMLLTQSSLSYDECLQKQILHLDTFCSIHITDFLLRVYDMYFVFLKKKNLR